MFSDSVFATRHPETGTDPLPAMFAERLRLYDLATEKRTAGDEILSALPEEIRRRRVMVKFPEEPQCIMGEKVFEVSIRIRQGMNAAYARADGLDEAEEAAWLEENIIEPAQAQWRTGMAEIAAAREASGCEALYREADEFARQADEIEDQICSTTATSLEGLLGQLQLARELDVRDDREERLNASIIAGVKRVAAGQGGAA